MALLDKNVKQLPGARKALGACFGVAAVDALLTAGQAFGLAFALTQLWEGHPLDQQIPWIALFLICYLARQLVTTARASYLDRYSRTLASSLRQQLAERIYQLGPHAVAQQGDGALITTLIEGVNQVQSYVALIVPKVTDLMVIPSILAVFLLILDPMSGIISLVIIPCIMFYMQMLGSFAKENAAAQHGKFQRMANAFSDSLQGMVTLKSFGRSKPHATALYNSSERFREATVKTLRSATLSSLVLDLFRVFALAAAAIMLGFRLMAGWVTLLPALAVLIIIPEFFAAVRRYSTDFHASLDGRNQLKSVLSVLEQQPEHNDIPYPLTDGAPNLTLDQVSFSYVADDSGYQALSGISLTTSGPLKVGIIGASGSGKSTLAHVLAGFASPTQGTFTVNDTVGSTLNTQTWQKHVTYIPQNPHIFHGTVRDNITFYCPSASEHAVEQAIRQAGLEEVIASLPQGLDTIIGEAGRALSGGQAQRIALARGFLDGSRTVLIFDEPTAHLDLETEMALKPYVLTLMEQRLVFFSTHRLHWMRDMDLIVVLEGGKIAECGTWDELTQNKGAFMRLALRMTGGDSHA